MIEELLAELFPEMKINTATRIDDDTFSIPYKNKWLHFPGRSVSEREKRLILQLTAPEIVLMNQKPNRWATFLLEDAKQVPPGFDTIQILQVMIKNPNQERFDQQLWLDSFKNTLPVIEDGFFIADNYGIVIIHNPNRFNLLEDIEGILNVLDDDFTIQSSVFLGQNWEVNERLPVIFSEEQQIFMDTRPIHKRNKIVVLSEIALAHYSFQATSKSPILLALKKQMRTLDGGSDLVEAMWHHLGNVSKAANELYVHRNTLQYRLDRYFEATGLNLKNMDDLLLSYLAVLSRTEQQD